MSNKEYVFGIHAVESLLKESAGRINAVFALKGRRDRRLDTLLQMAEGLAASVVLVERTELDRKAGGGNHQGIVAETTVMDEKGEGYLEEVLQRHDGRLFLLVLDGVTEPHNLGACLRSADAAGVQAVIAPKDKSAPLNGVARKVACGAAEHVPYVRVTNLARTLRWLKQYNIWLVGAAGEAEQTIYDADMTGSMALIMGAEGKGLRRLTREHCDALVKIPMAGSVSSLNVSVATGVCLFEAGRQRAVASN